jgi:hypothetical protein
MSEIDYAATEVTKMRKLILVGIAALVLAASASAASSKVVVAMHDPGCHWFYSGGGPDHRSFTKTLIRRGPVTLVNLDEASLKIMGPGGTKIERVGAQLTLKAKGVYKITMVAQAPDDNHLKLTIK